MNKAVFLDRDGTINKDIGYLYKIEDFEFIPGAAVALQKLKYAGYLTIIITNQSGIARGYYTEAEYHTLMEWIKGQVPITADYFCPHLDAECDCRKPATDLFYRAAKDWDIDFAVSWVVGDRERDLCICEKEPVRGLLIGRECASLAEAVEKILFN